MTTPATAPATTPATCVDASVGIAGYRSDLRASVVAPTMAVVDLWVRAGLAGVRVDGSTWEELSVLRGLMRRRAEAGAPTVEVAGGGPALVSRPPVSEREYWVLDAGGLEQAVGTGVAQGAGWLDVAITDPDLAACAIELGHAAGLRIAYRGPWQAVEALRPGDHLPAVAEVLRDDLRTPAELLQAWATSADVGARRIARATALSLSIGSCLLALRRAVFVKESLGVAFLEELEPILPHVAYVREMRRPGGYFVGKRHLRDHAAVAEPTRSELARAEEGWTHLVAAVCAEPSALTPASRSPQLTSVPGHAWVEECTMLAYAGVAEPARRGGGLLALDAAPS